MGVSGGASGAVEKTKILGLYPVWSRGQHSGSTPWFTIGLTSPTAIYFPSELNATHVAAFIRSFADDDFPPGESAQSPAAEPCKEAPTPASREDTAPRLRASDAGVP